MRVVAAAERDLEQIYDYVAQEAAPARADKVFQRLRQQVNGLALRPEHGSWPSGLLAPGSRDSRQRVMRPWRICCRVVGDRVVLLLIGDSRRNLKTLLERRLPGR